MYELKKNWKVLTCKSVGTGPSSYEKRIYRAAVSQRLRNTAVDHNLTSGCHCVFVTSVVITQKLQVGGGGGGGVCAGATDTLTFLGGPTHCQSRISDSLCVPMKHCYSASYSGSLGFKSRSRNQLSWQDFLDFRQLDTALNEGWTTSVTVHLVIHLLTIWRCVVWAAEIVTK
jgi:hypothetical protein